MRDRTKPAGPSSSPSPLLANDHFIVEPCSTCYIPGYLIVTPGDTVESLSQMNPAALAALGPTLAMTTAAIEAVVRRSEFIARYSQRRHAPFTFTFFLGQNG